MRRWLGYHGNEDAEIDQEELAREFPQYELEDQDGDAGRGERQYEAWIGGES